MSTTWTSSTRVEASAISAARSTRTTRSRASSPSSARATSATGATPSRAVSAAARSPLSIPLSQLGLSVGDKIRNVSAFATTAPAEDDPTATSFQRATVHRPAVRRHDRGAAVGGRLGRAARLAEPGQGRQEPRLRGHREEQRPGCRERRDADRHAAGGEPLQYRSTTASQGTCTRSTAAITCGIGNLASGASATVTVTVTPKKKGPFTNSASVRSASPADPSAGNNSSTSTVTVN